MQSDRKDGECVKTVKAVIILAADAVDVPNLHAAVNESIGICRGYGATVDTITDSEY